jgi:hypothetical protein
MRRRCPSSIIVSLSIVRCSRISADGRHLHHHVFSISPASTLNSNAAPHPFPPANRPSILHPSPVAPVTRRTRSIARRTRSIARRPRSIARRPSSVPSSLGSVSFILHVCSIARLPPCPFHHPSCPLHSDFHVRSTRRLSISLPSELEGADRISGAFFLLSRRSSFTM